ncbi:MAG: oligosaccharide flippase family protein [Candidatus Peribacteria bacterium]|nr:oligosaccharide flippase family protein [Candidatus Peribacteria bacterium]
MQKQLLPDETLAKKLITKGFWVYFFTFFVAPIGYILRMLVSNTLTVAEIGIFYSVLGLVGLIATYNDLGLTEALQYFIPKYRIAGEKAKVRLTIFASFLMQMLTGIVIFCGLYFGAEWLATVHFHDIGAEKVLKILAFYFLGYNIIQLCTTVFTAFQDTFAQGVTGFLQQISNLIFTIIFWLTASLTLTSYSMVWIIGTAVGIAVGIGILLGKYRNIFLPQKEPSSLYQKEQRKEVLKQHFKYALRVFLVANVANLLGQVDQQVVVNVLGTEAAGLFSNFQALLMVFILIVSPLFGLMFPVTTELMSKQDTKKF